MSRNYSYKSKCLVQDSEYVRSQAGLNMIPETEKTPLWRLFLQKFKDPIIIILLVVWLLSMLVSIYDMLVMGKSASCLIEPSGIFLAVLLATGIGFMLEVNAEKEFKILNKKKDERPVRVLRWKREEDAKSPSKRPTVYEIRRCDVAKGDVVKIESGDEIPADGILIEANNLRLDESNFTGEPYTNKMVNPDPSLPESTYPRNFLLRGTIVLEGNALFLVTATGVDTEEGKGVQTLNSEPAVETPLNQQLNQLAHWITIASYVVAALIVLGRMLYFFLKGGDASFLDVVEYILNSVMLAVTLIVVAVPEGLPMSVTISLALSMQKMLKQNNLVRKLHACETMGATTVICTDKTGTLTKNQMQVREFVQYVEDDALIIRSVCVNSTAELTVMADGEKPRIMGSPTEGAILYYFVRQSDLHIDYVSYREASTILKQTPFTTETKYMETVAIDDATGRQYRYIKGAPEVVLKMCDAVGGSATVDEVSARLDEFQRRGMRTLGFAYQEIIEGEKTPVVYIASAAIQDPVREDVKEAIENCHSAGIRVIMVTGDVALTANEIGVESGILKPDEPWQYLTGADLAQMSDEELLDPANPLLSELKILSRARPEDKLRLVSLLQQKGEVVAVTGDGTNDALALKKAQVGLSMGDGTSRAKEASDITIIDNSFSSINKGVLWGRSLYRNIQRFIVFQMTINLCACCVVLLGAFLGLDSPLTVTQMLWVNLIMDTFAAVALATLPPDSLVMKEKPRNPRSHIVDRRMFWKIVAWGGFFFVFLAGLWQLLWHISLTPEEGVAKLMTLESARIFFAQMFDFSKIQEHLSGYELGVFFSTFVLLQFWNIFNARYFRTGRSFLGDFLGFGKHKVPRKDCFSMGFWLVAGVILFGQILIVNVFGDFFDVSPLSFEDWIRLILCTSVVAILPDCYRWVKSLS
ncbi:MAG: calcium-translocating P-type ATPase, PMCA-type [Bacteroidales bacterium]|nr:calcium-translocating P-type ATPase, PMCA-type [Bacteroidales bacterium]